jgi:hypothetical protein
MESCDFMNMEFPLDIQKFTKKQQVLVMLNIAIFPARLKFTFYAVCCFFDKK